MKLSSNVVAKLQAQLFSNDETGTKRRRKLRGPRAHSAPQRRLSAPTDEDAVHEIVVPTSKSDEADVADRPEQGKMPVELRSFEDQRAQNVLGRRVDLVVIGVRNQPAIGLAQITMAATCSPASW